MIEVVFPVGCGRLRRRGEGVETSPAPDRNASYGDSIMASKALPSPEVLRQLLRYEPETGKLFWLERPADMFPSAAVAGAWNTRWANQEAFTSVSDNGYLQGQIFGKRHLAHRVIWAMIGGADTPDLDHINGTRSDNCEANLRAADRSENMRNRGKTKSNSSGFKGVTPQPNGRWRAQIMVRGRQHYLGVHSTPEIAHQAYCRAANELHGEQWRPKS